MFLSNFVTSLFKHPIFHTRQDVKEGQDICVPASVVNGNGKRKGEETAQDGTSSSSSSKKKARVDDKKTNAAAADTTTTTTTNTPGGPLDAHGLVGRRIAATYSGRSYMGSVVEYTSGRYRILFDDDSEEKSWLRKVIRKHIDVYKRVREKDTVPSPVSMMEILKDPKSILNLKVAKYYRDEDGEDNLVVGKIVDFRQDDEDDEALWRFAHEDGDVEDLNAAEVEHHARVYVLKVTGGDKKKTATEKK